QRITCSGFIETFCSEPDRSQFLQREGLLWDAYLAKAGGIGLECANGAGEGDGGELFSGTLEVIPYSPDEAFVMAKSSSGKRCHVLVIGQEHMNRAVHGDKVALKLLPKQHWRAPTSTTILTRP
ncbi:unnamed protein product, partial [Chrysoparadoxa australica]